MSAMATALRRLLGLRFLPVRYPDVSTKQKAQALAARFANGDPPKLLKGDE